jgi:disulfide bond formation protein DsbB
MLSRMDATASPSLAKRWKPALSASALVLVGAAATILTALAFEHLGGYAPCPLCLEERYAYYFAVPASALALLAARRDATLISRASSGNGGKVPASARAASS